MKKIFLIFLFGLALIFPGGCKNRKFPPPEKWNILWIVIDDLNVRHLGSYGYSRDISPNIDRIAGKGLRFEYCITQAPWTLPSFASMLTSRYPYEVVLTKEYLRHIRAETSVARSRDPYRMPDFNHHWYCKARPEPRLFAEILKEKGFETFAWTNNQWLSPEISGLDRGFDVYNHTDKTDKYYLLAEEIISGAGDWIEGNREKRWFAFLHLMDPHIPYHDHAGINLGDRRIDRYDAEIKYMDKELGRLFSRIEKLGLFDRTIIVINADHGESISADGTRTLGHGGLVTMDVIRVPLLLYYPGCAKGEVVGDPVRNLDIMPTLLELLDGGHESGIRGKSLVPLVEGGEKSLQLPCFTTAVLKGPEQISLLLEGCNGVLAPAYGGSGFRNFMEPGKKCDNEEEVRLELESFQKEAEVFLSAAPEKQPVKLDPGDMEKLKALGYFK